VSNLSDILTATQNIVKALNGYTQGYLNIQGAQSKAAISSPTVVKTTSGRVCVVAVTTAGSTVVTIYDSISTPSTTLPIYVIPNTVGVYVLNMPTNFGIVVAPGTSQVVTVSYS